MCYVNNNLSKYNFNLGDTTANNHEKIDRTATFSGLTWVNNNYNSDFGGQWCFVDSFKIDDNKNAMQRITSAQTNTVLATRYCNNGVWSNWDVGVTKSDWGDIKQSYPSVISLKSGEWTKTTEITLASGTWIIIGRGDFPANGNGRRLISLNAGGAETSARNGFSTALPINGSNTNIEITQMRVVSSTETIPLRVYQDSGAALATYVCLEAIKIH